MSAWAQDTVTRTLVSTQEFNGYLFRVYQTGDYFAARTMEVTRNDSLLLAAQGAVSVVDTGLAKLGNDITERGEPDALIEDYTGGAHCCFVYYVLELGKKFAVLDTLDTRDAGARFEDLDHDGRLDVITGDNTFAYWNAPFVSSPAPQVILSFHDGRYRVADHLMRRQAPSADSLQTQAEEVRADTMWGDYTHEAGPEARVPSELWRVMLDLIYTGHADLAWSFLDQAWPKTVAGKERFRAEFRKQLLTSRYYDGINRLNGNRLTDKD
jgi:hypothetical protein